MSTSIASWVVAILLCLAGAIAPGLQRAHAQTRWCGPATTYRQPAASQADVLTSVVAINRGFNRGIYNSAQELEYVAGSPAGTEWAYGVAADYETLTFQPWGTTIAEDPLSMVGRDMVVHLIAEDIYLDLRFTAWAQGPGSGSRFSYVRSTPGACTSIAVPALPPAARVTMLLALLFAAALLARVRRATQS